MAKSESIKHLEKEPIAKRVEKNLKNHGVTRKDHYYWLKDRESKEVIDYLNQENDYTEKVLQPVADLREELFEELKERKPEAEDSVPYEKNGYFYYSRFVEGGEYPIYCRKKGNLKAKEEVLLDVNKLAEGKEFFQVASVKVSDSNDLLAYALDEVGRRKYKIKFLDLKTGKHLDDEIENTSGSLTWAATGKDVFYVKREKQTLRSYKVFAHQLGKDSKKDKEIFHEKDDTFYTGVYRSLSGKYLFIYSESTLSSETRWIPADKPYETPHVFHKREADHLYEVGHSSGDKFYVKSNYKAKNFRVLTADKAKTDRKNWKNLVQHRDDVFISDYLVLKDYLILEERISGLTNVRVISLKDKNLDYKLSFNETAFDIGIGNNHVADAGTIQIYYSSMTTPTTTYEIDLKTGKKKFLYEKKVLGGYDKEDYVAKRLFARARDGMAVAVTLVHHVDTKIDGTAPMLVYGYGSYGSSIPPYFSMNRVSLLDRGWVFAIAHVRGSQTFGKQWYENGKLFKKKNTFNDFIDVTEFLRDQKFSHPQKIFAAGGSAGGLLMGAIMNQRPDLYRGIVAHVPFVDVVTTMLDDSIPLTTFEYDEWGNPNKKKYFDYMLEYSPYDNVTKTSYPALLVTTGLHDSQVQYWEPAKWVAKLRHLRQSKNPLVLKTDMSAGHGGKTGRYKELEDVALEYSFLIGVLKDFNEKAEEN